MNAGEVDRNRKGLRTMVGSFHHMPPPVAKKILSDAFHARQPLLVFELSDNSAPKVLWWLSFPIGIPLVLLLTPFIRPFSLRQFFFTYVIPILPLLIAWDGSTSNARTYTEEDLRELTKDLQAPDYAWEVGRAKSPRIPGNMLYLIGQKV